MVEKALWNECLGAGMEEDSVWNPKRQVYPAAKSPRTVPRAGGCSGVRLCPVLSFFFAV